MKQIKKEQSCLVFSHEHQLYKWIVQLQVNVVEDHIYNSKII